MAFNHEVATGAGYVDEIFVDVRCTQCSTHYKKHLLLSREEAFNTETEIGNELYQNGYVSFQDCGDCYESGI